MKPTVPFLLLSLILLTIAANCSSNKTEIAAESWPEYNGDAARSHYSTLTQINAQNVNQLKVAWMYSSGGADTAMNRTQTKANA